MTDLLPLFQDLQRFVGFTDADAATLRGLEPIFAVHGAAITDAFYERILNQPETAALVAGRLDHLKRTHTKWMGELFTGEYGMTYLHGRWRIGLTHVRIGVPPMWVEMVISFLRTASLELIAREVADEPQRTTCSQALIRLLDLDLAIINLAYAEDRLDRLSEFTGMSRKLIERCVVQQKK